MVAYACDIANVVEDEESISFDVTVRYDGSNIAIPTASVMISKCLCGCCGDVETWLFEQLELGSIDFVWGE